MILRYIHNTIINNNNGVYKREVIHVLFSFIIMETLMLRLTCKSLWTQLYQGQKYTSYTLNLRIRFLKYFKGVSIINMILNVSFRMCRLHSSFNKYKDLVKTTSYHAVKPALETVWHFHGPSYTASCETCGQ